MSSGKFLGSIAEHGGDGSTHVDKATVPIKFVHQVAQRFDEPLMSLKGVVQLHLEVALFNGLLDGKQQLGDKAGRSFEQEEVSSVLQGLDGGLRIALIGLEDDGRIGSIATKAGKNVETAFRASNRDQ